MADPYLITRDEEAVVQALAAAWNAFVRLPIEHGDNQPEFRALLHALQDKVLARPGRRQINSNSDDIPHDDWTETWAIVASASSHGGAGAIIGAVQKMEALPDSMLTRVRLGDLRALCRADAAAQGRR